jgi:uncharacterized oxidoreductase
MKTTGNTILITGGSSGIGLGFAQEFLRLGNKVIICARNEDKLNKVKSQNSEIIVRKCDVSIEKEREDLFSWININHPETNVLINNAGVQLGTDIAQPLDMKRVNAEIDTNIIAPLHLNSLFIPLLKRKNEAAIINITSGLAFAPIAFMGIYCATKAAMHSLTMSLRHQLRKTSIKVFEIAPPSVDTELGHDRRTDKTQSHGGISVAEFLKEAMEGISGDVYETCVGQAKALRTKREDAFGFMNK